MVGVPRRPLLPSLPTTESRGDELFVCGGKPNVNFPHAIDFMAACGANSVTQRRSALRLRGGLSSPPTLTKGPNRPM